MVYDLFNQLALEIEDVAQDLASSGLATPILRVADCGCGNGFSTLSLLTVLSAKQVLGIDQNSDAIRLAKATLECLRSSARSIAPETHKCKAVAGFFAALSRDPVISFHVGDILTGEDLPNDQDLVYCRKVLAPIHEGEFNNPIDGPNAVQVALEILSRTIKPTGHLLLVEKKARDFRPFLEKASLNIVRTAYYERGDIGTKGRIVLYKTRYVAYLCAKD
ncbi:MAG: methyltransferase domain-containing protein [Dehalococcoidia bacterium]|nr:MAG: methyltransferase domain-containing protein [Dehalococcoidia bacterium]